MFFGASLIQYHTEQSEHVRGQEITGPIMTIDAANRYGLTAASLVKYYGNDQHGQNIQDPLHTVISKDHEGLTTAHLVKMKGTNLGGDVYKRQASPTIQPYRDFPPAYFSRSSAGTQEREAK